MAGFLLRRLGLAIVLTVLALSLNFVLIRAAPGDPVAILAGETGGGPEFYAQARANLGLDGPLTTQYLRYLTDAATGDFGRSIAYREPVVEVIAARAWPTFLLVAPSITLSALVGVWAGIAAGRRAGTRTDEAISSATLLGESVPSFWLGQILVIIVAVQWDLAPVQGMSDPRGNAVGLEHVLDVAHHLVLPVLTLSFLLFALIARLVRASVSEVLDTDYIRTAHAKGLRPRVVLYRHGLRNALLPVWTAIGSRMGALLTGVVLIETIFSWPGLGRLMYDATLARDYPLLLGLFLLASLGIILANLVTDLIYLRLDPRVEYG